MELKKLTQTQFEKFSTFIYDKSGIRIDERKITLLSNRIRKRLTVNNLTDFDAYYHWMQSLDGQSELEHFLDAITTNETSFFRTMTHFDWFREEFLSEQGKQKGQGGQEKPIRVWSAGCATGAEPYTIAICCAESRFQLRGLNPFILGTDISEQALSDARKASYGERSIESVNGKQRRRFFVQSPTESNWLVKPEIKKLVSFKQHNLLEPLEEDPFDCIFIRNVLIYFDRDSKKRAIMTLLDHLVDGGYLVVGPSEGIYDMLSELKKLSTFLYQK